MFICDVLKCDIFVVVILAWHGMVLCSSYVRTKEGFLFDGQWNTLWCKSPAYGLSIRIHVIFRCFITYYSYEFVCQWSCLVKMKIMSALSSFSIVVALISAPQHASILGEFFGRCHADDDIVFSVFCILFLFYAVVLNFRVEFIRIWNVVDVSRILIINVMFLIGNWEEV